MMIIKFNAKLKSMFFDRLKLLNKVHHANARNLSKAGAFIRRRARTSMPRRKKPSPEGKPPHTHSKSNFATLKNIPFFIEEQHGRQSVIVGPVGLNHIYFGEDTAPNARGQVPFVLEHGGKIAQIEVFKWGRWRRADNRSRRRNAGLEQRLRTITIKARPFMGPALKKEQPNFPELWSDTVHE